jgi:hypothetical protein
MTGAPTPDQITVAVEALKSDAALWSRTAAELRDAAATAAEQVLEPSAFSFAGGAVAAAYEALRGRTAALLTEGADNADAIAAALRASAAAYAADEAAGAHRLHNTY